MTILLDMISFFCVFMAGTILGKGYTQWKLKQATREAYLRGREDGYKTAIQVARKVKVDRTEEDSGWYQHYIMGKTEKQFRNELTLEMKNKGS